MSTPITHDAGQGVATLTGSQEVSAKYISLNDTPPSSPCQQPPSRDVLRWFNENTAAIIPTQCAGFMWNTEDLGKWVPFPLNQFALANVVQGYEVKNPYRGFCRGMFITSTGSDRLPKRADIEEKDLEANSVHRWGHLCFDLDDKKDRGKALADLQTIISRLFDLDVQPQKLAVFWSGGKGFHLVVYDTLIGSTDGHKFLSHIYKEMALEIGSGLTTLDASIYNKGYGKQFRLPNVKRQNGQHKIPLEIEEVLQGTALTVEQFEELAKQPRLIPLPPLSTTADGAPIRALYARKKAEVEAAPKQATVSITWDDGEREALRENVWPCIAAFIDQNGYYGGAHLNDYAYRVIKPFCQETETDITDAMTVFAPVIVSFESETYTDDEAKLRHVEQELRRVSAQRWSCSDARRFIDPESFSCDACPRRFLLLERSKLEASTVFNDMPYDLSAIDKRADEELKVDAVIQLMQSGPDKELFDSLFRRGKRLESSFEVSDARLCQLIAFYAGSDIALVDAVYRRSSLMRPYWDTGRPFDIAFSSYAEETLNNACLFPRRYDPARPDEGAFPEEQKKVHRLLTGADIMAMQFDNPPLIDGLLDEGESLGILGANGLGKSLAVLDIALALADPKVDKLWGRYRKTRQLKVIIFQSEVTSKALKKRLTIMVQERPEVMELIKQLTFPSFGVSGRIAGSVTDDTFYGLCRDGVMKVKPDVIVFDPLISYHDGSENDPREMRGALDRITRLQDETGTACILTHHLGENSSGKEVFKGRGSSAIGDWLANIMLMEKAEGTSIKEPLIKVTPCKARNFELTPTFYLQRTPGLHLVPTAGPESADAQGGKEAVVALKAMGGTVAARARLVEYLEEGGASESTAKRWVTAAVSSGQIKVVAGQGRARGLTLGSAVEEVLSEAF